MATKEAHLAAAEKNAATILYLLRERDDHPEWIAIIAFYKALHLVEAVFFDEDKVHGVNHERRDKFLKDKYPDIHKHYRPLWAASMVARYLSGLKDGVGPAEGGKVYAAFTDCYSPQTVENKLLKHRLFNLEKLVKKALQSQASKSQAS